jgi:hypothetical protein
MLSALLFGARILSTPGTVVSEVMVKVSLNNNLYSADNFIREKSCYHSVIKTKEIGND